MSGLMARRSAAIILLGLGGSLLAMTAHDHAVSIGLTAIAAVACMIAWARTVYRPVNHIDAYLQSLTTRGMGILSTTVAVLLLSYFTVAAFTASRPLYPTFHDEHMYLLQARMLSEGHLALPEHECSSFFDTFYVIVKPVYSSMYFPGTALAYMFSIWLKLPWSVFPLLITTAALVMTFLVASRILESRLLGLCTLPPILGIESMGYLPTMSMSHTLAVVFGTTMIYAWLRWSERAHFGWAMLCGAMAGWMVITRPAEGTAFSAPILIAVLCTSRSVSWRQAGLHTLLAILAALPFLLLLAAHNRAVTGSVFNLPIDFYVKQEFVGLGASSGVEDHNSAIASRSELAQKQVMFQIFVGPMNVANVSDPLLEKIRARVTAILFYGTPNTIFIFFLPLAAIFLNQKRIAVLFGILIGYVAVYSRYPAYLPQYSVQIAPILLILSFAGHRLFTVFWPDRSRQIKSAYVLVPTVLSLISISQLSQVGLWGRELGVLDAVHRRFPTEIHGDALILIKYDRRESPHVEPVYNLERAKIDDNRIVLAHDLGAARNREIIAYYAAKQRNRSLYYFDRRTFTLTSAGTVRDAAMATETTTVGD